ncbi:MAG: zinc ribbon domain-containing protein [Kiritimatiellae bacterium]|nr:zinc ribbon domain-containing protein [Kiritimatiellia bacterium]
MPLFEYRCLDCDRAFEALVSSGDTPRCPHCGSERLRKLLSAFAPVTPAPHRHVGCVGGDSCDACPSHAHGPSCPCCH